MALPRRRGAPIDSSRTSSDQGTLGRLVSRGDPALLELVGHELSVARLQDRGGAGVLRFRGRFVRYTYGPIERWHGLRRGVSAWLRRSPLPGLDDFERLAWLRRHGLGAPRPLAAGTYLRRGVPQFRFIYKEAIDGAADLRAALGEASTPHRTDIARALAEELSELHLFGFVHGDLHPRNVLVTGAGDALAIHFDAPTAGLQPGHRPGDDLATLMLAGATLFDADEQATLLGTYFGRSERHRQVDRRAELSRLARRRAALATRDAESRRATGRAPIDASWSPPFLRRGAA